MEEMSYVFSFTFFSLPLIFTLHWHYTGNFYCTCDYCKNTALRKDSRKTTVYLECFSWSIRRSLIVDRLVSLIVVLRPLNMWELYIAVDCWIALNRVVTSKDTVLLICLNQRSGVKRIPQHTLTKKVSYKRTTKISEFIFFVWILSLGS